MKISSKPRRQSLTAQLLGVVFFFYILVTVAVTTIHMCAEFAHVKKAVRHELSVIGDTFAPGLARALWDMNVDQVQPTFLGLVESPTVVGMMLKNEEGDIVGRAGIVTDDEGVPVQIGENGEEKRVGGEAGLFEHSFSIVYRQENRNVKVGSAVIYSSTGVIFDKVKLGFVLTIGSAIIQTLVLWFLILWISRTMLSRPLSALAEATKQITLDKIEDTEISLDIKGHNELKVLEESFNSMLSKLKDSRNELSQRNQQFKAVVVGTPSVIFVKDAGGRYMFVNPRFESLFHVKEHEVLGRTDHDVFPRQIADDFRHNDLEVIRKRRPLEVEEDAPQDDGIHTYISVKYPLFDDSGNVTAVCGIATDISARKKSEKVLKTYSETLETEVRERTKELVKEIEEGKTRSLELLKLNKALAQTANPVVITDKDGNIEYVNRAFAAKSGYPKEELIGSTPRLLKSGHHSAEFYEEMWSTISRGDNWSGEIYNRKKNGDFYWERMTISPIKDSDGTVLNYISVREEVPRKKEDQRDGIHTRKTA